MAKQKRQTAIRLSEKDEQILDALVEKKGGNKTTVLIWALRDLAEREGILQSVDSARKEPVPA